MNTINRQDFDLLVLHSLDHPFDCQRIVRVASTHGLPISALEADHLWREYSENEFFASFLYVDTKTDDQIWEAITTVMENWMLIPHERPA